MPNPRGQIIIVCPVGNYLDTSKYSIRQAVSGGHEKKDSDFLRWSNYPAYGFNLKLAGRNKGKKSG